ncbi:hypothetical protein E2C01_036128 [Portunus trituberculatus]|uniref:Uncharacterized protein n=1 Tax=Portunus trituberculatus TaxID=210409 RepID=A0A5B7FB18_PORTR|nr:hypothetical protein [Portunus trituberculatus]
MPRESERARDLDATTLDQGERRRTTGDAGNGATVLCVGVWRGRRSLGRCKSNAARRLRRWPGGEPSPPFVPEREGAREGRRACGVNSPDGILHQAALNR